MRQYLLDLYEIQKIDLNIREQEKRLEALPARLRELETSVGQLRAQISTLTEQRSVAVKEAQGMRTVVEEETQKIRKWEARLNDIRNQREYQALNRETEGSKRANRDAEEKISELFATRDGLDKQLETLQIKLTDAEDAANTERNGVDGQMQALKDDITQETARRDALVPRVPKALFRKYDGIRSKRFGVGLAMVSQGNCTVCNIRLPPQLYNILQRGDTIEQCPSCQRLMFWENILPTPDAAAGTAP